MQPKDKISVVLTDRAGDRCLAQLEWGFIPAWDRSLELRGKLYNLRVETILASLGSTDTTGIRGAYADAVCGQRAILPVSDALERSRQDGQLYRLLPKSGEALYIAALWSQVQLPDGQSLKTVGMVTTGHESIGRIPLFLAHPLAVDEWLSPHAEARVWGATFLERNKYTGNGLFEAARKPKRCAEPSPETSRQTRLSLP